MPGSQLESRNASKERSKANLELKEAQTNATRAIDDHLNEDPKKHMDIMGLASRPRIEETEPRWFKANEMKQLLDSDTDYTTGDRSKLVGLGAKNAVLGTFRQQSPDGQTLSNFPIDWSRVEEGLMDNAPKDKQVTFHTNKEGNVWAISYKETDERGGNTKEKMFVRSVAPGSKSLTYYLTEGEAKAIESNLDYMKQSIANQLGVNPEQFYWGYSKGELVVRIKPGEKAEQLQPQKQALRMNPAQKPEESAQTPRQETQSPILNAVNQTTTELKNATEAFLNTHDFTHLSNLGADLVSNIKGALRGTPKQAQEAREDTSLLTPEQLGLNIPQRRTYEYYTKDSKGYPIEKYSTADKNTINKMTAYLIKTMEEHPINQSKLTNLSEGQRNITLTKAVENMVKQYTGQQRVMTETGIDRQFYYQWTKMLKGMNRID